ncbi:beta-ketoacyl-ACP synthase [Ferrimonas sp. SCSIO 43195]|uniref:beta-ketoacyl-ACP synthase n=1 Tax=Ferrimonas sp. SCSIO 43195 TaxID=2822844 RepID=UPI00207599F3|nr:beta-ketoacyl-ACP synthase [Ferrimonas sp. SCSIO 43195]
MNGVKLGQPGVFSPLGNTPEQLLRGILAAEAGAMASSDAFHLNRATVVGQAAALSQPLPESLAHWDCRNNRMLANCCEQIDGQVQEAVNRYGRDRLAVILGTSTSGIEAYENTLWADDDRAPEARSYDYRKQEMGTCALFVAERFNLPGIAYTISTACSSAAKALAAAARLLQQGKVDAVICGGSDSLCRLTINGFDALESYSKGQGAPLTQGRDGINIGEASVLFVMTREAGGVRLCGAGESSDAHHVSAPHPQGHGAEAAMRAALAMARISPQAISYINLHGTGTPLNDAMECDAVFRIFGDRVPVSSTKGMTGHTLGAAGALEAAMCWALLSDSNSELKLPPQRLWGEWDSALAPVSLAQESHRLPRSGAYLLSNSFAFGGSNIALIFSCER